MKKIESGFYWGVLAGIAAVAIAGAVALTISFRSSKPGGGSREAMQKGTNKPRANRGKARRVQRKR
jgi:hypothetical protein